jgi:site-specific DNA-methyltransferase (adenine-specific)
VIQGQNWVVHVGNNLDILPTLPDNSVDSIVTDPPYELGFMGKKWDSSGIAYSVELWKECLRVLKPGGHLLSFGGTRTWHRVAVAIEDAGFDVRDSIAWMYGSGFPKSLDVSKAIDKQAGAEREVIGQKITGNARTEEGWAGGQITVDETAPSTPEAKQWEGWGTALKPAFEPIVVARKPLIGTVAENVLKWGTGGLNIDGSRIAGEVPQFIKKGEESNSTYGDGLNGSARTGEINTQGRWPANVILDEYSAELLDEQSGITKSGKAGVRTSDGFNKTAFGKGIGIKAGQENGEYGDSGGASRFFYVAKASKRDRNEGLDDLPVVQKSVSQEAFATICPKHKTQKELCGCPAWQPVANFHPTVKPTELMKYLIKLVTPPNGTVLDPFTGSGSTGKAALLEGFRFIGIEMTEDYIPIIEGRLKNAEEKIDEGLF